MKQFLVNKVVVGGVEAAVSGVLAQRQEHALQSEVTLGVALVRVDGVVVVEEARHGPVEHLQHLQQRLAHMHVAAHHAGQGGELAILVHEVVRLGTCRQHWHLPHTCVPCYRCYHVVTHRAQERTWGMAYTLILVY